MRRSTAWIRSDRLIVLGLFAVSLAILGFQVSNSGLAHPNELLYAESARDMYERGDWLTPYFNGKRFVNVLTAVKEVESLAYHEVISPWERENLLLNV